MLSSSTRRNTARLKHQDLASLEPAFIHQSKWNACGFAGTWWRDQDSRGARGQDCTQFNQDSVNRKRCDECHSGCI
jgi:hypothetical protein